MPLFCLNVHPIHIVMDIHSLQEVLLYINKMNIILVGCIVWPAFLYVLSSIPGVIIFIICCLPLIGCSVLIVPPQFVDWPFCINLMISVHHNNLIVPARKFISYILICIF